MKETEQVSEAPRGLEGAWLDLTNRVRVSGDTVEACSAFSIGPPRCRWLLQATDRGVNCAALDHYVPHICGTHTETVYHIAHHRYIKRAVCEIPFFRFHKARIQVCTAKIACTEQVLPSADTDYPCLEPNDLIVGPSALNRAPRYTRAQDSTIEALILIVVGPDGTSDWRDGKLDDRPPYLTPAAIESLATRYPSMRHLLTNLPSVDRRRDGGLVRSHRAFFATDFAGDGTPSESPQKTITELLRVPPDWQLYDDAEGVVCISLAPIEGLDAIPSSVYFKSH